MAGSIMLIVLVIAMIVFMLLGSRKQKKMMEQRYSMLSELLPGDEVSTTAGVYGTVVKVSDTKIDLMIADGVVTTWDLNSVRGKVEDTKSDLDEELETAAHSDSKDADKQEAAPRQITENKQEEMNNLIIPDTPEGLDGIDGKDSDHPKDTSTEDSDN